MVVCFADTSALYWASFAVIVYFEMSQESQLNVQTKSINKAIHTDWLIKNLMLFDQTRWSDHTELHSELGNYHCAEESLKEKAQPWSHRYYWSLFTPMVFINTYLFGEMCLNRERLCVSLKTVKCINSSSQWTPQAETKSAFPCLVSLCEKWETFYPIRNNAISKYLDVCWKYVRCIPWSKNKNKNKKKPVMWPIWQKYWWRSSFWGSISYQCKSLWSSSFHKITAYFPSVENQLCVQPAGHPIWT